MIPITPRSTRGFSTLELIAVLGVVLVLILLAWPSIQARRKAMLGEELRRAMDKGDHGEAIKLLKRGAPPDAWRKYHPHACVYCRALENRDREMFQLAASPENTHTDAFRYHGPSLLVLALEQHDAETVNFLLNLGVSVTQRYQHRVDEEKVRPYMRRSPLAAAIEMNDGPMVILLLSHASAADLQRPGHPNGPLANDPTLIHSAVRSGNLEWVKLLLERGVPVDAVEPLGETALHEAARLGSRKMVEVLLAHGTDPGILDYSGALPLDKAPVHFHDEMAQMLGALPQPASGK